MAELVAPGNSVLCSDHFEKDCFEQVAAVKRRSLDPRNDVSYDDTPLETPENPNAQFIRVNRALSNILMIKEMSLVSRHHQASQLEPHTQYHIADMVEGLLKKYPDSWYVHLPVSVLRFNCSVHPETKHRPLSLHCSEGTKLYTSPREQPVCTVILQLLCSHWQLL
ncbi:hypothetical protein cypCar_00015908, partial [Cyprinus carpio]